MIVRCPIPAPASDGITDAPIPPAPITATRASLLRCWPSPPNCGSTRCRAYRSSSSSVKLIARPSCAHVELVETCWLALRQAQGERGTASLARRAESALSADSVFELVDLIE